MRISASKISLVSSHTLREEHVREESLLAWIGRPPGENRPDADRVSLSAAAREGRAREQQIAAAEPRLDDTVHEDPQLRVIRLIVEAITGHQIKGTTFEAPEPEPLEPAVAGETQTEGQPAPAGWGLDYSLRESFRELETTRFTATGQVATADGRHIEFTIELAMHREFTAEVQARLRAGDAVLVDPLVVNFNGSSAELAATSFSFDLDLDGHREEVPTLLSGSGYLAFDRNGDGRVNDGGELFGPATGNGFAELAEYDADGNGWLDDNDPAFEKLAIWIRAADGLDSLASLHSLDIGALLLQPMATPFPLRESGTPGSIQELDLVV